MEIEEIRLPELNSCKFFTSDFLFSESEPVRLKNEDGRQEIKKTEEKRSSLKEKENQEGGETSKQKEVRKTGREHKGRKEGGSEGREGEEGVSEIQKYLVETSQIQIQKKHLKKIKKIGGLLRKNSDSYETVESKKRFGKIKKNVLTRIYFLHDMNLFF